MFRNSSWYTGLFYNTHKDHTREHLALGQACVAVDWRSMPRFHVVGLVLVLIAEQASGFRATPVNVQNFGANSMKCATRMCLNGPATRRTFVVASAASVLAGRGHLLPEANAQVVCVSECGSGNPRYLDYEVQMAVPDASGNSRTTGFFLKRYTGDSTPFTFPQNPVRLVRQWPPEPPFSKEDFSRMDETDDSSFYGVPRFVYHIDEGAVAALTQYYRRTIKPDSEILDICSSWVSHYPLEFKRTMRRISATGMNALELRANQQLSDFKPKNLNRDPTLPYDDASFDIVTCVVSIDYLISPIAVLKEAHRVLRPGGRVILSQSNRCFPTKAIKMWLEMNDRQHLELLNGYFQYAGGFGNVTALDITAKGPGGVCVCVCVLYYV